MYDDGTVRKSNIDIELLFGFECVWKMSDSNRGNRGAEGA